MPVIQSLPRVCDSWSFLYVESARVERVEHAVQITTEQYVLRPPVTQFLVLLLGPGSSLTHAAAQLLAEHGCSVIWCGEAGVRFYGHATPETVAVPLLDAQVLAWASPAGRSEIARRMFRQRFAEVDISDDASIDHLRGLEGVHMRTWYARMARAQGVTWAGRDPMADEPLQQAINVANSCLYGICHAAIVAVGMSPALGFMHHGNQRSFVFDMADLYKVAVTLPIAFATVVESPHNIPQRVRRACRDAFRRERLLERIVPDLHTLFGAPRPWVRYTEAQSQDRAVQP
jgi:CRISPR-associated protein Cas1